jgi:nucleoside 2-deoxyribosyltransferase
MNICPLCLSIDGFKYAEGGTWDHSNVRHDCDVCGLFGTTGEARDDYLGEDRKKTTPFVRAALTHWTRQRQAVRNSDDIPLVTSEMVEGAISGKLALPNPGQQATNIIGFVGDETKLNGEVLPSLPPKFHACIGSIRRDFAVLLLLELANDGLLTAIDAGTFDSSDAVSVRLSLRGWERYESEQKGQIAGNYGFIALKFGDEILDPFLSDHIRPAVASLGLQLRDMRDSSRAGIIDNLMRIEIRDSAFVLVDLTHDNSGAYWEAGYAEGMGKPVLYICEKSKFELARTHFDTNHCTTVVWDAANPTEFKDNLIATLKRSLII